MDKIKMDEIKHTQCEWECIFATYLYELKNDLFFSNEIYDNLCDFLTKEGNNISGFDKNTGIWIHDLLKIETYAEILNSAFNLYEKYKKIDKNEGICMFCLIDKKYISEENSYENFPGRFLGWTQQQKQNS